MLFLNNNLPWHNCDTSATHPAARTSLLNHFIYMATKLENNKFFKKKGVVSANKKGGWQIKKKKVFKKRVKKEGKKGRSKAYIYIYIK